MKNQEPMRTSFILITLLFIGLTSYAQNDLIVFAEDGEQFILHVNGEQVNDAPAARVVKRAITEGNAAIRIVFEGDMAPDLKKNIPFLEKNTMVSAKITMTNKGYKLRYFGEEPIAADAMETTETEKETVYIEIMEDEEDDMDVQYTGQQQLGSTTTTIETTTTTTGNAGSPSGESVEMNVGVNGFNMGVDIKVDDNWDTEESMSTTTTTTTTTTNHTELATNEVDYDTEIVYTDENCYNPTNDVSRYKSAIDAEAFADDRLMIAKQSLRNACLRVDGVIELARLFDFEDDRLEFVKYCYDRTYDLDNFYQVNSVFEFSDSKDELNSFLEEK